MIATNPLHNRSIGRAPNGQMVDDMLRERWRRHDESEIRNYAGGEAAASERGPRETPGERRVRHSHTRG